jgi:hypothetical protein
MNPGRHAAGGDRAGGVALGRGVALVLVAVVLGVVVLRHHRSAASAARPAVASRAAPSTTAAPRPGTASVPAIPPGRVRTLVANGTTVPRLAARIGAALHSRGFDVIGAVNTTSPASASAVYFAPGYADSAATVASDLGLAPSTVEPLTTPAPVANLEGADVLVVAGPDLAMSGGAGSSGSGAASSGPPGTG